jgi:hypothetical protein
MPGVGEHPAAAAVRWAVRPPGSIRAPLFIGQGETDELVLPSAQAAYVQQRCAQGGKVDYRTYPNRDHVGVVKPESPLIPGLMQWTQDRIDGNRLGPPAHTEGLTPGRHNARLRGNCERATSRNAGMATQPSWIMECAPGPQGRPDRPSSSYWLVVGRRKRPIDGLSISQTDSYVA